MICLIIVGLYIVLVNSQFPANSWIDLMTSASSSISLDFEKVQAFELKPSNKFPCQRNRRGRCGMICTCIETKTQENQKSENRRYCCRQRKDWDSLSHVEKTRFLRAVYDIATGRRGWFRRNRYVRLLYIHEQYWLTTIHQRIQFFPWHRIYLLKMENLLRSVDCRVTIPYWDWTKNPSRWWESSIFSWSYFGSNTDPITGFLTNEAQCPTNGYFAEQGWFRDTRNECLVRQFDYSVSPASYLRIQRILSWTNFQRFESALRHEHGVPHFIVGGEDTGLFFSERAAEDPLFWLHHCNVDYQWYQRQTRYLNTRNEFWGESNVKDNRLTAFGETIEQAINPYRQGIGGTCVEYVENDERYEQMLANLRSQGRMGSLSFGSAYTATTASRVECMKSSHRFPPQIFTIFRTSPAERNEFTRNRNEGGDC